MIKLKDFLLLFLFLWINGISSFTNRKFHSINLPSTSYTNFLSQSRFRYYALSPPLKEVIEEVNVPLQNNTNTDDNPLRDPSKLTTPKLFFILVKLRAKMMATSVKIVTLIILSKLLGLKLDDAGKNKSSSSKNNPKAWLNRFRSSDPSSDNKQPFSQRLVSYLRTPSGLLRALLLSLFLGGALMSLLPRPPPLVEFSYSTFLQMVRAMGSGGGPGEGLGLAAAGIAAGTAAATAAAGTVGAATAAGAASAASTAASTAAAASAASTALPPLVISRVAYVPHSQILTFFLTDPTTQRMVRAFTRIVPLPKELLAELTSRQIDVRLSVAASSAASLRRTVFNSLWSAGYCFFLWKIVNRMLQGPTGGDGENVGQQSQRPGAASTSSKEILTFDEIKGQDSAKLEVSEITEMLKEPTKYVELGVRLPSGILLVGPPGSGKTLLARVTANMARVPFFACSASDFVEVFVGRGPARVRKLFAQAQANAPSIVFIDELDSIGRNRKMGSLNTEQENTLNALLTCMDGLDTSNNGVIVMAATNRLELLDPALLRAGRFDRIVQCPLPDKAGRQEILQVHARRITSLSTAIDWDRIARQTAGCSGADLSALVNEASIRTIRRQGREVSQEDFDEALRAFVAGRSALTLAGLAENAANNVPEWLKKGLSMKGGNDVVPSI